MKRKLKKILGWTLLTQILPLLNLMLYFIHHKGNYPCIIPYLAGLLLDLIALLCVGLAWLINYLLTD